MSQITERHRVLAGVIWLDHTPIASVDRVRVAADPEAIWITLAPGRDYGVINAEAGHIYVSALVGTLVEVTYTVGADTARPRRTPAWSTTYDTPQYSPRLVRCAS